MLNAVFILLVLSSLLFAAYFAGHPDRAPAGFELALYGRSITDAAGAAVKVAIGLIGAMAFFLGLMRVATDAGAVRLLTRVVAPVMRLLFPGVPRDHPAIGAMMLNIVSNMLGLTNAATPFGIKAMHELNKLNGRQGTATNAMVMFLAMNTSGLALLPTGMIATRASVGSADAAGIMPTTWFASGTATLMAVTMVFMLQRLRAVRAGEPPPATAPEDKGDEVETPEVPKGLQPIRDAWFWVRAVAAGVFVVWLGALIFKAMRVNPLSGMDLFRDTTAVWTLSLVTVAIVLFGFVRGVSVYESLIEGAKEGFNVAVRIIPYLVAIIVAASMFRASGAIETIANIGPIRELLATIGMPIDAVPVALVRPLSGSGAHGLATEVMQTHGADSFIGYLVSTMTGSTDTTFYVLAVYFGAVGVKRTRHTVPACLAADVTGILAAVTICNILFR